MSSPNPKSGDQEDSQTIEMPTLSPQSAPRSPDPKSPANPTDEDPISRSERSGNLPRNYSLSPEDLVEEPESVSGMFQLLGGRLGGRGMPMDTMPQHLKDLHPYSQILGPDHLESCTKLEHDVAGPEKSCSREKLNYHLNTSGELSLAIFTSATKDSPTISAATAQSAIPPDSSVPSRKGVLLAQLIATKTTNALIEDEDLELPAARPPTEVSSKRRGHNEAGRTLAVQSLAVLRDYQRRGLGRMLLRAYIQRMADADIADRIVVLVDPSHTGFYEKMSFENRGTSAAKCADGRLVNMVYDFATAQAKADEL